VERRHSVAAVLLSGRPPAGRLYHPPPGL